MGELQTHYNHPRASASLRASLQPDSLIQNATSIQYIPRNRPTSVTAIPRPISTIYTRDTSSTIATVHDTSDTSDEGSKLASLTKVSNPGLRILVRECRESKISNSSALTGPAKSAQLGGGEVVDNHHWRLNKVMPPSSFHTPEKILTRSETLPAYQLQAHTERLVPQETLHIGNFSRRGAGAQPTTFQLPKSRNTAQPTYTPSKHREVTPRTLLRPIQPPLPRSQTTGHFGCFPSVNEISPAKPARRSAIGQSCEEDGADARQISNGTLENSRADKNTAANNQHRRRMTVVNETYTLRTQPQLPGVIPFSSSVSEDTPRDDRKSPITINLSINDVANTQRLEKQQQQKGVGKRSLFINTTLANKLGSPVTLSRYHSTPRSGTTFVSTSSAESSANIKNVFRTESSTFWTGRYVAATDRMRQHDCDSLLKPGEDGSNPLSINSAEFEKRFDDLEITRMSRVLEELYQCCKTSAATKSLIRFETQLKRAPEKPSLFVRSYSEIFAKSKNGIGMREPARVETTGIRQYSGNYPTSQVAALNAQATIGRLSDIVTRKGGLVKSKTTGDFSRKPSTEETFDIQFIPTLRVRPKDIPDLPVRKTSQGNQVSNTRQQAIRERETRSQASSPQLRKISSQSKSASSYDQLPANFEARIKLESDTNLSLPHYHRAQITDDRAPWNIKLAPDQTSQVHHGESQLTFSPVVSHTNPDGETVEESIRRPKTKDRRYTSGLATETTSGGAFMKKMVGAGIRGVRKMSRRVGSGGLNGSSEDLDRVFR